MPTSAIGDLQGCHAALEKLLEHIEFDAGKDRIWLVGDLINRGTGSAAILRWAMGLGDALVTVLGNHDLHTLAVAEGFVPLHRSDTIQDVLQAPDRDELLLGLAGPDLLRGRTVGPRAKQHMPAMYEDALAKHAGGAMGTPEDVARAVPFLASPAASHISGVNLVVDGAFTQRVDL